MVDRLRDRVQTEFLRQRSYLSGARDEIRSENLNILCNTCAFTVLILVGCLLVTPLLVKGWSPSPAHWAFAPTMLALAVVSRAYRSRAATKSLALPLCIITGCTITCFGILIDTVYAPMSPSVFTPMILVALAAVFIVPLYASGLLTGVLSLCYALAAMAFKDPFVAQYDLLSALVSFVFAICVAHIIMNYRLAIHESKTHFQDLSMRDDLSSVLNKRALFSLTKQYFENAGEHAPCTLIFIDVDGLKAINDTHGHLAGDEVLRAVGELLQSNFRSTDIVGRFGGDEFVVFAPGPVSEQVLAEKTTQIREQLAERTRQSLGFVATISAGAVIAEMGLPEVTDLIRRADTALYQSKRDGKNRLTVHRLDLRGEAA